MISWSARRRLMEEFRIAGVLFQHPLGRCWAVTPAGAWQIKYEIGVLVEVMLSPHGLNIVAVDRAPAEAAVELSQQVLLSPRVEPIDILRLQGRCVGVGHDSDRLQVRRRGIFAPGFDSIDANFATELIGAENTRPCELSDSLEARH